MIGDFAAVFAVFFEHDFLFMLNFIFGGHVILVFAYLTNQCKNYALFFFRHAGIIPQAHATRQ